MIEQSSAAAGFEMQDWLRFHHALSHCRGVALPYAKPVGECAACYKMKKREALPSVLVFE
jgi:hypothetical protein